MKKKLSEASPVLEGLLEPAESQPLAKVDPNETLADAKERDLASVEDELFNKSSEILSGALSFADIDPENPAPPSEWLEKYGPDEAGRRFRLAKYALMSAKEAPVGIKVAESLARGIMKSRALQKAAPQALSVAYLSQEIHHHYAEKDVEDDQEK